MIMRKSTFTALGATAALVALVTTMAVAGNDGAWTGYVNPATYPAENPCHSAASQAISLNAGLVPAHVETESLEARYCTSQGSSGTIAYDPNKFGTLIIVR